MGGFKVKKRVFMIIALFLVITSAILIDFPNTPKTAALEALTTNNTANLSFSSRLLATLRTPNYLNLDKKFFQLKPPSPATAPPVAKVSQKRPSPKPITGIYCTSWIAGHSKRINEIIDLLKTSDKINALVIDVKDATGKITYQSQVPLAKKIKAGSNRAPKLKALVARLKEANIYPIARIVVFKDPLLAKAHRKTAVRSKRGGIWKDRKGKIWVDPHNRQVWQYNIDIAKEAVEMGFAEIQFDYVRFLSDGRISDCVYPFSKGEKKEDVIANFLLTAKKEINALGVPISADIFGLVTSIPNDLNIGQNLEKIANAVDFICPMVYPSHYPRGTFKIKKPDLQPYEVVYEAMKRGVARLEKINSKAKFRPWLQDFSLGNPYGVEQIQAQIKALNDNGIDEWLFWNPRNKYKLKNYQ